MSESSKGGDEVLGIKTARPPERGFLHVRPDRQRSLEQFGTGLCQRKGMLAGVICQSLGHQPTPLQNADVPCQRGPVGPHHSSKLADRDHSGLTQDGERCELLGRQAERSERPVKSPRGIPRCSLEVEGQAVDRRFHIHGKCICT